MLRQGVEPRGIFGSGWADSDVFEKKHWDQQKAKAGKRAKCIKIRLSVLLNPDNEPILPRDWLNVGVLATMYWNTQSSGVRIPDAVATALTDKWEKFLDKKSDNTFGPTNTITEEVSDYKAYFEGATKKVAINVYERNPEAREKCLKHYGFDCYICDFNFERVYGPVGKDFIHVHHLKPLSEIGERYLLDPIKDLRPVCPNCHAIIHRRNPPFTVQELRDILMRKL
jgi:5-methylcytosine-specific restriction protein A